MTLIKKKLPGLDLKSVPELDLDKEVEKSRKCDQKAPPKLKKCRDSQNWDP